MDAGRDGERLADGWNRESWKYLEVGTVFEKAKWNLLLFTNKRIRGSLKLAHRRKPWHVSITKKLKNKFWGVIQSSVSSRLQNIKSY